MARSTQNAISKDVKAARRDLKRLGYTYQVAAEVIGISYGHLAMVLSGRRESRRLLSAIHALPHRAQGA